MKKLLIVWSNIEPDRNVIWLKDGLLRYFNNGEWQIIGLEDINNIPQINLSNYYTKSQIDSMLSNLKVDNIDLSDYYNKESVNALLSNNKVLILNQLDEKLEKVSFTYNTDYDDNMTISTTIGGIQQGDKLSTLKGKTFSEILDKMLISEIWNDPKYNHSITVSTLPSAVRVGSDIVAPKVVTMWNPNITPISALGTSIDSSVEVSPLGLIRDDKYLSPTRYTWKVMYSYGAGTYDITSSLGNKKTITVEADSQSVERTVDATYPIIVNEEEHSTLVPFKTTTTLSLRLSGSPVIKIPGRYSKVSIRADVGLGYMDVSWRESEETVIDTVTGDAIPYKVFSKPDSYAVSVPHQIVVTLSDG